MLQQRMNVFSPVRTANIAGTKENGFVHYLIGPAKNSLIHVSTFISKK